MTTDAVLNDLAARHVGSPPGDLRAACPICGKGPNDDAVSVTVNDDGDVVAHCHRCGESGTAHANRRNGHKRPAAGTVHKPSAAHVALWESASVPGEAFEHPYLTRKQVGAHGVRVSDDVLLVPARDVGGVLTGVERIAPDGEKKWVPGSEKSASFHMIGEPGGTIAIAEGYATAASIYEATGTTVAVAFDAGNLIHVAKALRSKYPGTTLIVAADDDVATRGNPGRTKATAAAKAVGEARRTGFRRGSTRRRIRL